MFEFSQKLDKFKCQLDSVKTRPARLLFPPSKDMSLVKENLCPFCSKKLKFARHKPIAYCDRKRCPAVQDGDRFVITLQKLAQINA